MSILPSSSRQRAPLTGRRILVVEDEYFLADDIGKALRALGAEIAGPVGHIEDAIEMLHDGGVLDAAVLDVNIRAKPIFPVARELRARQVPFVFTTGYDRISIEPEFQDVPIWEKPIDVGAMVQNLASLLDGQPAWPQQSSPEPAALSEPATRRGSEQMREGEPDGHCQAQDDRGVR